MEIALRELSGASFSLSANNIGVILFSDTFNDERSKGRNQSVAGRGKGVREDFAEVVG